MKTKPPVIIEETPAYAVELAKRRTRDMLRLWFLSGIYDFDMLVRSIYFQGVVDGVTAVERQFEKENFNPS
jgi:hypothetical protein